MFTVAVSPPEARHAVPDDCADVIGEGEGERRVQVSVLSRNVHPKQSIEEL